MRYVVSVILVAAWALWFGGIITLLIGVSSIFSDFPADQRHIAGKATAAMFRAWGFYELAVGAVTLVAAVVVRLMVPSKLRTALFVLLAASAALAAVTTGVMTPKIEAMRIAGETQSDAFKSAHGQSMILFSGRTLLLLVAGLMLPACIVTRHGNRDQTAAASNSASS